MSDDKISLDFLGEQMLRMQADLRDVRSDQLRLEKDQTGMRTDLSRIEAKLDNFAASVGARFDQVNQTAATNLEVVLHAIKEDR